MEHQTQRSLQSLVKAAYTETFSIFDSLKSMAKHIESTKGLHVVITVMGDNHNQTKLTWDLSSTAPDVFTNNDYQTYMRGKLAQFHSQTKYIQFEYSLADNPKTVIAFRLSKLRSRNVRCIAMMKSHKHYPYLINGWAPLMKFNIGQYESDGEVTIKLPWFIRLLMWAAHKVNPQSDI